MQLLELKTNCPAELVDFGDISLELRKKLIAMGMRKHSIFTVVRKAPLQGPWHLKINSTEFTIRMQELRNINVKQVDSNDE